MEKSNQADGKRYLYGKADEKFVKEAARKTKKSAMSSFKFRANALVEGKTDRKDFNKTDVPIVFKCTPDMLINLCLTVLDALPLGQVYDWCIEDICKWLRESGFHQYQNTFRTNLITGRNLLQLDASALAAMNVTDFEHIQKITKAIRDLFQYQMSKFGRCISLYPEFHNSLYKLLRLKTGEKYNLRRSEVWRKMQMIRGKEENYTHWEALEQWLAYDKKLPFKELIGGARRSNIYACKAQRPKVPVIDGFCSYHCSCIPPCECFSWDSNHRRPWLLKCLPHLKPDTEFVATCGYCVPPCNCRWPSKSYQIHGVLSCLKTSLPHKYDCNFGLLHVRRSDQICFSFFPKI